jgi:circadian clock protein KaiB
LELLNYQTSPTPPLFKGIALFTPGGDLVYCIDPSKKTQWHVNLCATLQEWLGLVEPPHFLVPCYTATFDRWLDPNTQVVKCSAVAYPPVWRYRSLLNLIFETHEVVWSQGSCPEELCDPIVVASYRERFPQLWENHDLVLQVDSPIARAPEFPESDLSAIARTDPTRPEGSEGYVLRLFVSGRTTATEKSLHTLYQVLEESLGVPYTLKVIDIHKHPEQAEFSQISATPTLIKLWPLPVRRIVGNLEDPNTIARVLGYY